MLSRHRFLFAISVTSALTLTACQDDTAGGEATEGFEDSEAPGFDGVESVTPQGTDALAVSWQDANDNISSADEISYRVYLATEPGAHDFTTPDLETAVGETSATLDGLSDGQAYYVVVHAVDEFGNEDDNARERVGTVGNLSAPDFSGITLAVGTSGDSIMVTWPAASDSETPDSEIIYNIYLSAVKDGQDFDAAPYATSAPGATELEITGLDDYTGYWVAVRAEDSGGLEDDNDKNIEARTFDGTPPDFDGLVDVVTEGDGAYLEWTAAQDNVTHGSDIVYQVFASTSAGGQDFTTPWPGGTSQPGAFSITVDGLDLDTEYFFVVRAQDEQGLLDDNSVELSSITGLSADETAPVFGGALLASTVDGNTINVAWDPADDADTAQAMLVYDVFVSPDSGGQNFGVEPATTSAPGTTNVDITGLTPESEYYVVVRARDLAGNRDTNVREVSAASGLDGQPPVFAGGTQLVATGPQTLELSWAAASDDKNKAGEIVYRVFISELQGGHDFASPIAITSGGQTFFEIEGLEPDTEYFVVVRAQDSLGNFETNTVELSESTLPDTIAPTFVSAPTVSEQGLTTAFVDWEAATDDVDLANQITYEVYITTTAGVYDFVAPPAATATPGITEANLAGLVPGTEYFATVRAIDRAGNPGDSAEASDTTTPDVDAPTFPGVFQILGAGANNLTFGWPEASDNYNVHGDIIYHYCLSDAAVPNNPPTTYGGITGCAGGNFRSMGSVTGEVQALVTGLDITHTYYVVVRAEDQFGNRDTNNALTIGITTADVAEPTWDNTTGDGTSQVNATTLNEGQATLSWNQAHDNVTSDSGIAYDIYVAEGAAAFNYGSAHTTVIGSLNTTVVGLTPSTLNRFVVRARDLAANRTNNTDEDSATTSADNTAPTAGVVTNVTATDCDTLSISWSQASDLGTVPADMAYDICVGTSGQCGGSAFTTTTTRTGVTSFSFNVANAGNYTVKVRARDTSGNSSTNNTSLSVDTSSQDGGSPTTPGTLTRVAYASTPTTIRSSWGASTDSCWSSSQISYQVCMLTNAGHPSGCSASDWTTTATTVAGDTDLNYSSGIVQDTTYWVGVRAVDGEGNVGPIRRGSMVTKVSFEDSGLEAAFTTACAGCHGAGGIGWTHSAMVGQAPATSCSGIPFLIDGTNPATAGGIVSANTGDSKIYNKLNNSQPCDYDSNNPTWYVQMPASGTKWTTISGRMSLLSRWINQGAENN